MDVSVVPQQTTTQRPDPAPLKRCAIVGTAQSWKQCPWNDTTLEVWGLNDAYLIGVPRADRWYDLHPIHQMHFRQPSAGHLVDATTVPVGVYLRPAGHLEWLKSRPMPVYMAAGHPAWATVQTFPAQAIFEFFRPFLPLRLTRDGRIVTGPDYEVSTPSLMLMQAIMEGYQEIHIYGIHLATQWEYLQQRPNFEFYLGFAAARGIKVVLPSASPVCRAAYRYAFEPKADIPVQQLEQEITIVKQQGMKLRQQHASLPWYARRAKKTLDAQLLRLDVILQDTRQAQQRAQVQMEAR